MRFIARKFVNIYLNMPTFFSALLTLCFLSTFSLQATVQVGLDLIFTPQYSNLLKNKKIGLITNQTALSSDRTLAQTLFKEKGQKLHFSLKALFAPEHGIDGSLHANDPVKSSKDPSGIPIHSLHGATFRPNDEMLKGLDLLVFDIQDIGIRSYTYAATLFYAMEEAAKRKIPLIVLDRPNPINGVVVDGLMMEEKWRSIVGYLNVPYCHGMTIGELALFFNEEYKVGCRLTVVPMRGWKRSMSFGETGLSWVPTSPHVPEPTTPCFAPMTGILGEIPLVNIGIGYTMPFKLLGAPWIDAARLALYLNAQRFPGVSFLPIHYKPFYGQFAAKECHGVQILITDPHLYLPVTTQYLLIGMLKSLYPKEFGEGLAKMAHRREMFCKINGTEKVYELMCGEKPIVWELREMAKASKEAFMEKRKKYLIADYDDFRK